VLYTAPDAAARNGDFRRWMTHR